MNANVKMKANVNMNVNANANMNVNVNAKNASLTKESAFSNFGKNKPRFIRIPYNEETRLKKDMS